MKLLSSVLTLAALLASSHVYAACVYPKAPEKIPDGATATKDEMIAAQKAVKAYNDDIKTYTDCLKAETADTMKADAKKPEKERMTKEQKDELDKVTVQKNNAAVDEAQALTDRFNEQIRAFNAKGKPKS
jgi:hypothetical protein